MDNGNLSPEHIINAIESIAECSERIDMTSVVDLRVEAIDDKFDKVEMIDRLKILRRANKDVYEDMITQLAEKGVNGVYDRATETQRALEMAFESLFSESRTPRFALTVVLMKSFEKCLDYLADAEQVMPSTDSVRNTVELLYDSYIKNIWSDSNSHLRNYCLHGMVDYFSQNASIVPWEHVRNIMQYAIHDYAVVRKDYRTGALKELARLCSKADREMASTAANYFQRTSVGYVESPWTLMMDSKFSSKTLNFCDPPLHEEWFVKVLQGLITNNAQPSHINAALRGIKSFRRSKGLYALIRTSDFSSAKGLENFAKAARIWWHKPVFDNAVDLIISKKITPSKTEESWLIIIKVLVEVSKFEASQRVYGLVESLMSKYVGNSLVYLHCVWILSGIYSEKIINSEEQYFESLIDLIIASRQVPKGTKIKEICRKLREMSEKWNDKVFDIGGADILQAVDSEEVPLCLAGWTDESVNYPVAAKFQRILLSLRRIGSYDITRFKPMIVELSHECVNLRLSSFHQPLELYAVTKSMLQLSRTLSSSKFIPIECREFKFCLPWLYRDLFKSGIDYHRAFISVRRKTSNKACDDTPNTERMQYDYTKVRDSDEKGSSVQHISSQDAINFPSYRVLGPRTKKRLLSASEVPMLKGEKWWRQATIRNLHKLEKSLFIVGPVSIEEIFPYINWYTLL